MASTKKRTTKSKATPKRRTTKARSKAARATAKTATRPRATAPNTGSTLTRTFKGKEIRVEVTADGYRHAGTTYKSLTALAKVVTGYKAISGPRFFGIDDASNTKGGA